MLHVGVNLDLNIDPLIQNIWFTKSDKLSFAPSPNIQLEWHTKNRFFHLYADVKGSYGTAAMEEIFAYNRYVSYKYDDLHAAPYTPIDATLGFKLRPSKTLLINIYGGYAMVFDQFINISNISEYGWKNTSLCHDYPRFVLLQRVCLSQSGILKDSLELYLGLCYYNVRYVVQTGRI